MIASIIWNVNLKSLLKLSQVLNSISNLYVHFYTGLQFVQQNNISKSSKNILILLTIEKRFCYYKAHICVMYLF
jgi:hypothetical protein